MDRRTFLKQGMVLGLGAMGITAGSGLLLPEFAHAEVTQTNDFWTKDRYLAIRRSDTKDARLIRFFGNGQYLPDEYQAACWMLRDAKDMNQMVSIDVGLLNLMYAMQEWARMAGKPNPLINVNSAYRTARRNAHIEGAARNSMHIKGQAVDITVSGIGVAQLAAMAKYFKVGGVGTYSTFLHIDTGSVRNWRG